MKHRYCETLDSLKNPLVNHFYQDVNYPTQAGRRDTVCVVRQEQAIVAAVVLVEHPNGHYMMRGMVVAPMYRGQGVGSQLLAYTVQQIKARFPLKTCYCFPFAELRGFYQQAGFSIIAPEKLPDGFQGAYYRYREQGKSLISMMMTCS